MSCGCPINPNVPKCRCPLVYNTNVALGDCPTRVLYGECNTTYGIGAGQSNSGSENTFVGGNAGQNNTTASGNSFFGCNAGQSNTTGNENTFIGESAGRANTTGGCNTFVGQEAGLVNTTGSENTFVGENAGRANTTGGCNTFIGQDSGLLNTTGQNNTFLGENAGDVNTTGNDNVVIGQDADANGDNNVMIGQNAGSDGNNNVVIGQDASNATFSNTIVIGNNTTATATGQNVIGYNLTPGNTNVGTFIDPIRSEVPESLPTLHYNTTTKEVTYSSFDLLPPGVVLPYGGSSTPSGYLLCDGQAISRTTFSALFAAIGILYGPGNGTTTFNVPDLRSRFPIGAGQGTGLTNRPLASTGGLEAITDVPAHTHTSNATGNPGLAQITGNNTVTALDSSAGEIDNVNLAALTINSTGLPSVNVVNPYLALNYIIKC